MMVEKKAWFWDKIWHFMGLYMGPVFL